LQAEALIDLSHYHHCCRYIVLHSTTTEIWQQLQSPDQVYYLRFNAQSTPIDRAELTAQY